MSRRYTTDDRQREEDDRTLSDLSWDEELSIEIDDAVKAAEAEFLDANRKPKKEPFIAVTELAERGLDQSKVSFSRLINFLADRGLDFEARRQALRRLAKRRMPISGRSRSRNRAADQRPIQFAQPTPAGTEET